MEKAVRVASAIASVILLFAFHSNIFLAKKSFSLVVLIKSMLFLLDNCIYSFFIQQMECPGFIENTTFLLTYATIFLVLMSLGIALSRLKVLSWAQDLC